MFKKYNLTYFVCTLLYVQGIRIAILYVQGSILYVQD